MGVVVLTRLAIGIAPRGSGDTVAVRIGAAACERCGTQQ
jgi:hypothetical protein